MMIHLSSAMTHDFANALENHDNSRARRKSLTGMTLWV